MMDATDFVDRHLVVPDDLHVRIDRTGELIQVIGKTVIIIYQQYHKLLPPSASASATITAFALLMHS